VKALKVDECIVRDDVMLIFILLSEPAYIRESCGTAASVTNRSLCSPPYFVCS